MIIVNLLQCDQIERLIVLWATFLSLWQQLFCPNCHIFRQFDKGVKIFHFSSEISIWRLFTSHTGLGNQFDWIKAKSISDSRAAFFVD